MQKVHRLQVDPRHNLYLEERGNPDGVPILFLHGGPGTGISPSSASYFDPNFYRIILFDQRGAGQSTPFADVHDNTIWHLIEDIEKIRLFLGIERWVVFGGSWGATLAVAYAENYPSHVLAMIVRGILLGEKEDLHWLLYSAAPHIWPKEWEEFIAPIAPQERSNLIEAYWNLIQDSRSEISTKACRSWSLWEARNLTLASDMNAFDDFFNEKKAKSIATIELHYFRNRIFLPPNYLLDNAHKLASIHGKIVHGRYDTICPFSNSWKLHKAWPGSEFIPVEAAGHAGLDPAIHTTMVQATEDLKTYLSNIV